MMTHSNREPKQVKSPAKRVLLFLWTAIKNPFSYLALLLALSACASLISEGDDDISSDAIAQRHKEMGVRRETVTVPLDGVETQVSYLIAGDPMGQRVIFVHGTPGTAMGWERYLTNVTEGFEYVAIDRPGFGRTDPNSLVASLDAQAAALAPLLDTLSDKKPILVGHSLGGPVVAAAAANYSDRVGGVIELAGSVDPGLEEIKFIQYIGETPPFVWLLPKWVKNTNREVFALKAELITLGDKLDRVTAPVIIIHGTKDGLVPYANVDYMLAKFASAQHLELITLEEQNHFLPWNSEMYLRQAILRMADGFPGDPMPHVTIDARGKSDTPGFNPPAKVLQ